LGATAGGRGALLRTKASGRGERRPPLCLPLAFLNARARRAGFRSKRQGVGGVCGRSPHGLRLWGARGARAQERGGAQQQTGEEEEEGQAKGREEGVRA
jgi:hypothetical protein